MILRLPSGPRCRETTRRFASSSKVRNRSERVMIDENDINSSSLAARSHAGVNVYDATGRHSAVKRFLDQLYTASGGLLYFIIPFNQSISKRTKRNGRNTANDRHVELLQALNSAARATRIAQLKVAIDAARAAATPVRNSICCCVCVCVCVCLLVCCLCCFCVPSSLCGNSRRWR
jgi:hypothetical protein